MLFAVLYVPGTTQTEQTSAIHSHVVINASDNTWSIPNDPKGRRYRIGQDAHTPDESGENVEMFGVLFVGNDANPEHRERAAQYEEELNRGRLRA